MLWVNIFINTAIVLVIIYFLNWAFKEDQFDIIKGRNSDILDNDSVDVCLDKIELLSEKQLYFPKWRRCLIMSVIITISLSVLLFNNGFNMRDMLIILLCNFTVIYSFYNFYDYHYYKKIERKIYILCNNIRKKNPINTSKNSFASRNSFS